MPVFKDKKWRLTELNALSGVTGTGGKSTTAILCLLRGCELHLSALVWSLEGEIPVHQLKHI